MKEFITEDGKIVHIMLNGAELFVLAPAIEQSSPEYIELVAVCMEQMTAGKRPKLKGYDIMVTDDTIGTIYNMGKVVEGGV